MPDLPRLRQVALVAGVLAPAAGELQRSLSLGEPFHDPGVGTFGLENSVFATGDTFLEVVAPIRDGTTAGRYLDKRGGDGGYMAIFQVPDTEAARQRAASLGIRIVWQADLDDISGTHFHPKDVPGAIVSVDTPTPPGTWRWAGPAWTANVPDHDDRTLAGIVVECSDPDRAAEVWGALLDVQRRGPTLQLDGGRQVVMFREGDRGIVEVGVNGRTAAVRLCGVTFTGGET